MKQELHLDAGPDSEAQKYIGQKAVGDRCQFTVEGIIRELNGEAIISDLDKVIDIKKIEPGTSEPTKETAIGAIVDAEG